MAAARQLSCCFLLGCSCLVGVMDQLTSKQFCWYCLFRCDDVLLSYHTIESSAHACTNLERKRRYICFFFSSAPHEIMQVRTQVAWYSTCTQCSFRFYLCYSTDALRRGEMLNGPSLNYQQSMIFSQNHYSYISFGMQRQLTAEKIIQNNTFHPLLFENL